MSPPRPAHRRQSRAIAILGSEAFRCLQCRSINLYSSVENHAETQRTQRREERTMTLTYHGNLNLKGVIHHYGDCRILSVVLVSSEISAFSASLREVIASNEKMNCRIWIKNSAYPPEFQNLISCFTDSDGFGKLSAVKFMRHISASLRRGILVALGGVSLAAVAAEPPGAAVCASNLLDGSGASTSRLGGNEDRYEPLCQ